MGNLHIEVALAGDVLEGAAVDDAGVCSAGAGKCSTGDLRARYGVVRDGPRCPRVLEHGPHRRDVLRHVVLELPLREAQKGLHPPAGVVVVDVDREEVAYLGLIYVAGAGVGRRLPAQLLHTPRARPIVAVYEIVGEGVGFLAEEVNVVTHPGEGPAKVLNVDVAPRAGEHVAVRHEEPRGFQPSFPHIPVKGSYTQTGYDITHAAHAAGQVSLLADCLVPKISKALCGGSSEESGAPYEPQNGAGEPGKRSTPGRAAACFLGY